MSGTNPRRRHSPAVYRRRRLVLLIAVLAVIAIVWLLIAQPWSGSASDGESQPESASTQQAATELPIPGAAAETPQAEPAPDAEPTETTTLPTPSAVVCAPDDILVEALSDQDSYGSGQNPQLSIRLTNEGDDDCTLNVGTSTQVFTIASGSDTWWRSTDCQTEPSDMPVLLAAGQAVTSTAPLEWDRTRSSTTTCADPNRETAPGGGASYHLSVEIGGISSSQSKQLLLY
jgi:hypothetical protein